MASGPVTNIYGAEAAAMSGDQDGFMQWVDRQLQADPMLAKDVHELLEELRHEQVVGDTSAARSDAKDVKP